jgi:RimJ/RimL family protein N-acetyltransferase
MLRQATVQDISYLHYLYMHDVTNPFLLYEKMDLDTFRPIISDLISKGQKFIFVNQEGQDTGMCKLYKHTFRCSHIYYLGGLAIDPARSDQGYGTNMVKDIINYCLSNGSTRIELSVSTANEKAIKLYEKLGFKAEGVLKNYCYLASEGRYIDELMMAYLITYSNDTKSVM